MSGERDLVNERFNMDIFKQLVEEGKIDLRKVYMLISRISVHNQHMWQLRS